MTTTTKGSSLTNTLPIWHTLVGNLKAQEGTGGELQSDGDYDPLTQDIAVGTVGIVGTPLAAGGLQTLIEITQLLEIAEKGEVQPSDYRDSVIDIGVAALGGKLVGKIDELVNGVKEVSKSIEVMYEVEATLLYNQIQSNPAEDGEEDEHES